MKKLVVLLLGLLFAQWSWAVTTVTKPTHITINPVSGGSCPVTVGTLTLNPTVSRASGVSPLLVFFDSTGTTDTATLGGANNAFQDVYQSWNFGDGGSSGTANWLYGSNPAHNSRNLATGPVAAHLYIVPDGAGDTNYTINVSAFDGTNTAACTLAVTAFDPSGANGFAGANTTCYFNSTVGSGCPASATPTVSAVTHVPTAGKRILYKCGDTFTGGSTVGVIAKYSIGAYGACANTAITAANQATFPQLSGTISLDTSSSDGRVSDLVGNTGASAMVLVSNAYDPPYTATTQITLNNLWSNATNTSFYTAQMTQAGYIQLHQNNQGTQQGTFLNLAEGNCIGGGTTYPCSSGLVNIQYTAVLGSHFDGTGAPNNGNGIEPFRISACRMCVFENNDFQNANNLGSTFKLHSGNNKNTSCQWTGQWAENIVISDNFLSGQSGAAVADWTAQNPVTDERLRNFVIERNIFSPSVSGHVLYLGVMNATLRDNVFHNSGISMGNRQFQGSSNNTSGSTCAGSGTTSAPVIALYPQFNEFYNNTCTGSGCLVYGGGGNTAPANNSVAQNNLIFNASGISNTTSNTTSNNTTVTTNNPGFTNASGTLNVITDYKPTAFFTLTNTPVPVWYDALGVPWPPTWSLGAVHP